MARPSLAVLIMLAGCGSCEPTPPITATTPSAPSAPAPPVAPSAPAPRSAAPPMFGIGGGEADPHTHVEFDVPGKLVGASVRVVVDRVAPVGLNFFALQVDFDNGTWAHGGVQDVDGPDGSRTRQINWGGLVDRGGGNADYDEEDDRADLEAIQNPPAGLHVGPYAWRTGVAYEYLLERGAQVTLPPGSYRLIPDQPPVRLRRPRTMWEWRFTVRPVAPADGAPFVAVLYDAADAFTALYVWNESGYGSTDGGQHTTWSALRYTALGSTTSATPTSWSRF